MDSRGHVAHAHPLLVGGAALLLALALLAGTASAQDVEVASSPAPSTTPATAWMTYTSHRAVGEGTGAYAGYTDRLEAAGRYDFTTGVTTLGITASYRWTYFGERCEAGSEDRSVAVGLGDRLYQGRTDLDDYDEHAGGPFATWVWVPTTLAVGDHARILERDFVVVDDALVTLGALPAPIAAIHLRAEGEDRRDDAYGSFRTRFVDEYWFDRVSGFFLRSVYRETDEGTLEGAPASVVWTEEVEVNGASYLPGTVPHALDVPGCGGSPSPSLSPSEAAELGVVGVMLSSGVCLSLGAVVALLLLVLALISLSRRARNPVRIQGQLASVRTLARAEELPAIAPEDSPRFGPFLRHFVEQALAAQDVVAVCELADKRCVGLGISDREGRITSIFAKDGDACELLRARLGWSEIFTEHRHEVIPSVLAVAQAARSAKAPEAYNVLETYEILECALTSAPAYDASVVGRMTPADLPEVGRLSQEVYGLAGTAWMTAALALGDVGYVARVDGKIVGYGFASVCGAVGRLYGNTVSPAHRGKGLGRELVRARLSACSGLGAERVITEVATWNVGSLEIVRAEGFATVGSLWVESSLAIRPERKVVRR